MTAEMIDKNRICTISLHAHLTLVHILAGAVSPRACSTSGLKVTKVTVSGAVCVTFATG
jgi:hypothetical protein